jgi:hypothetical protein
MSAIMAQQSKRIVQIFRSDAFQLAYGCFTIRQFGEACCRHRFRGRSIAKKDGHGDIAEAYFQKNVHSLLPFFVSQAVRLERMDNER